jgi:crotonobetaine/carnitine-CoA ligase
MRTSEIEFPTRDESVLSAVLGRRAADHPGRVFALYEDGTEWTYRQALEESWRAANALRALGVQFGERVSALLPPCEDTIRCWLGVSTLGAVFAPINLAARARFLEHTLNIAEAKVAVIHGKLATHLLTLDLPALESVVLIGDDPATRLPWPTVRFSDILADASPAEPDYERLTQPWDDALLIYTSGTTGPSKGVRLSHASQWLYDRNFIWPDVDETDRFFQALPIFHLSGIATTFSMIRRGGSIAVREGFSARTFWRDIRQTSSTVGLVLHAMVSYLLQQEPSPEDADNPLRVAYMGPLSHVKEFSERFGVSVYTAFGMTEVPVPIRSGLNPENETSCGQLVDPNNYELRIVDENDVPVAVGNPGELVVRHRLPWVLNSGYLGMPEATLDAWRNGWFHTGDQFREDEGGSFYFLDRVKDAIRRRGENISSFEVEAEVLTHPDVREAAAVAVANPDVSIASNDEEVKIVVVLREDSELTEEGLIEYLIPRMPSYWVPRFVEFVSELPATPSFKVRKSELRALGITDSTWDRERAGIVLKRERLT